MTQAHGQTQPRQDTKVSQEAFCPAQQLRQGDSAVQTPEASTDFPPATPFRIPQASVADTVQATEDTPHR